MTDYYEDSFIQKCLSAAMCYNQKQLRNTFSDDELLEINFNDAWRKVKEILANDSFKKSERLKLSTSISVGAMLIRKEKAIILQKRLEKKLKEIESMKFRLRLPDEVEQVVPVVDMKLFEVPDINLKFPMAAEDCYILSEEEEKRVQWDFRSTQTSQVSGDKETLEQMMLGFKNFCIKDRAIRREVPEMMKQFPEEQRIRENIHEVPEFPSHISGIHQETSQIADQVSEISHQNVNMEVESRSPDIQPPVEAEDGGIPRVEPGTPSKRPTSITGDDTPSKRRRIRLEKEFESTVPEALQQLPAAVQEGRRSSEEVRQEEVFEPIQIRAPPREFESAVPEPLQQLPAAVQEGRRSSEEVRQEEEFEPVQIRAPPSIRKKIKKGLDERLQLSNDFLMNYRQRTKSYMTRSVLEELRLERPVKPLAPKFVLTMPGFTIQNENLKSLFEEMFENVSFIEEPHFEEPLDNISSEERRNDPNESEQIVEQVQQDQFYPEVDAQKRPEIPRSPQEELNLIVENQQPVQQAYDADLSDKRRSTMENITIQLDSVKDKTENSRRIQSPNLPLADGVNFREQSDLNSYSEKLPAAAGKSCSEGSSESSESDVSHLGITEMTILNEISELLYSDEKEFVFLEELIPTHCNDKRKAAWYFFCMLVLQKKKKLKMSQDGSTLKDPICVMKY